MGLPSSAAHSKAAVGRQISDQLAARLTISITVFLERPRLRPIGPQERPACVPALNGRWRLISAMYACTREGPYKIPCAIDTGKPREAGVFDVRFSVVRNQLILHTKMFARH